MSRKEKSVLSTQIDATIFNNTSGQINANNHNALLKDLLDSLIVALRIFVTSQEGCVDDADISLGSTTFGTDNITALQTIFDEALSGPILVIVDGHYSVSSQIKVYSNTTILGLDGCGFILRDHSSTPVLENGNQSTPVFPFNGSTITDHDITIDNLIINGNGYNTGPTGSDIFDTAAGGSAVNGSAQLKRIPAFRFHGVKRFKVTNCKFWGARYFSTSFGDCREGLIANCESDHGDVSDRDNYNYDGIHLTGSCFDISIRDIKVINSKDDGVALVSGSASVDSNALDGPIKRISINNIYLDAKALGIGLVCTDASDAEISDIYINNVRGQTHSICMRFQNFNDSTSNFGNITVENLNVKVGTNSSIQNLGGLVNLAGSINDLRFKNIYREDFSADKSFFVTDYAGTVIKNLTIENIVQRTTGGTFSKPFLWHKYGTITQLNITKFYHWEDTSDISAPIIKTETTSAKLDTVYLNDIVTFNISSLINSLNTASQFLNTIFANNIIHAGSSSACFIVSQTVANIYLNNFLGGILLSGTFTKKKGSGFNYGDATVASLPSVTDYKYCFVTDETGGAVPAFSDGTNWRRVTDRAIVS